MKRHKLWANLQVDVRFEREYNDIGQALSREEDKPLFAACSSNPLLNAVVMLAANQRSTRKKFYVGPARIDGMFLGYYFQRFRA